MKPGELLDKLHRGGKESSFGDSLNIPPYKRNSGCHAA